MRAMRWDQFKVGHVKEQIQGQCSPTSRGVLETKHMGASVSGQNASVRPIHRHNYPGLWLWFPTRFYPFIGHALTQFSEVREKVQWHMSEISRDAQIINLNQVRKHAHAAKTKSPGDVASSTITMTS